MAFEKFTKTKSRGFIPKVSIWKRGQIGFNRGAVEKFQLSNYTHVVLFYDKTANAIGFKFTNSETEEGAIKLSFGKTSATIGAKSFLNYYDIKAEESKKYDVGHDLANDMYIVQL